MIPISEDISGAIKRENMQEAQTHIDPTTSLAYKALALFKNGISSLEEVYPMLIKV